MIIMDYMLCGRNKPFCGLKTVMFLIMIFISISCGNKGPLVFPKEDPRDTTIDETTQTPEL